MHALHKATGWLVVILIVVFSVSQFLARQSRVNERRRIEDFLSNYAAKVTWKNAPVPKAIRIPRAGTSKKPQARYVQTAEKAINQPFEVFLDGEGFTSKELAQIWGVHSLIVGAKCMLESDHIQVIGSMPNLENLNVGGYLEYESDWLPIFKMNRLRTLILNCNFGPDQWLIRDEVDLPNLTELAIYQFPGTAAFVEDRHIPSLCRGCPKLTKLTLMQVRNKGVTPNCVAELSAHPTLKTLSVQILDGTGASIPVLELFKTRCEEYGLEFN